MLPTSNGDGILVHTLMVALISLVGTYLGNMCILRTSKLLSQKLSHWSQERERERETARRTGRTWNWPPSKQIPHFNLFSLLLICYRDWMQTEHTRPERPACGSERHQVFHSSGLWLRLRGQEWSAGPCRQVVLQEQPYARLPVDCWQ